MSEDLQTYLMKLRPTIRQQLAELEREKKMRQQVYPKLIGAKKLSQKAADWQMACLDAAIATLKERQG